jgi:hypothetical protein
VSLLDVFHRNVCKNEITFSVMLASGHDKFKKWPEDLVTGSSILIPHKHIKHTKWVKKICYIYIYKSETG